MKRFIISFAALATLFACTEKKGMEPTSGDRLVSIVASTVDTKTTLESDNSVVWESGDAVAVCFKGSSVDPYRAVFTTASSGNPSAVFNATLPNSVTEAGGYDEHAYAVYPAAKMADDGTVTFELPAEQRATETGSFESGLNLSSAVVSLAELDAVGTTEATFKNAFSIIRFTLDKEIKSVVITADAPLAGNAPMTFVEEGGNVGRLEVGTPTDPKTSVTLTPAQGKETFDIKNVNDEMISYNLLVYPGTFTTLDVKLTDSDNVVYERSLTAGGYTFVASKYYTFNFNTEYVKEYTFTATGREFAKDDKIATVFSDAASTVIHEDVLTADAEVKFTGRLPKVVVNGTDVTGYAVYPAEKYDQEEDAIFYTLPSDGTETIDDLYSASLTSESTQVNFTSVETALARIQFEVPVGITSITIDSDKEFVGETTMKVGADGKLSLMNASDASGSQIVIGSATAKTYTLYIYPVEDATFTFTLSNGNDEYEKPISSVTVPAGETKVLELSGVEFDKDGNFTNEDFTAGEGNYDFD